MSRKSHINETSQKRQNNQDRYSDISFNPGLDNMGDLTIVSGNRSIAQAIFTLFHTIPGSRVMLPGYGASLKPFLFEPFDEKTASEMVRYIRRAIDRFEPRIYVESVDIVVNETKQSYEINLFYKIIDNNEGQQIRFNLERL